MKTLAALLVVVGSLVLTRDSQAMVIVDYQFDSSNSVFSITSPVAVSLPPQGAIEGDIRVRYTSNGAGDIVDGPAILEIFAISATLNVNTSIFGQSLQLTGPASAELVNPVAGALTGNTVSFGGAMGLFHAQGQVTCGGAACALAGVPMGVPIVIDGDGSVPAPTLVVASIHGTLSGLTFNVGGVNIVASLVFDAPETNRQVPEPGVTGLLAVALLALTRRRAA